ncbi:pyruvate/ketoisovalerate oxidoreductase, gamma subunit [Ferroglobus placidus DSM 10642]|uniref:pyruvate synthase n=1 Tax=Ferroglobus placidus (strain DSM 10642 / AEDII12DO) TaxID=589924 RepID=D3RZQ6_FERPA|nr:2-oxoacid:acceptor oxidoreductase family protein [Ferroglobus placidus]ADC65969.1 pyruvate/ketoisovalerate oxidoreductase, gamma subunit [Ferroglobus placidus DSM 10642]
MIEVKIVSRGGQGGVTAARILAKAAMEEGLYSQAIPQFGAERRGAKVYSYLRIDEKPIRRHTKVEKPRIVAYFDKKLVENDEAEIRILNGIAEGFCCLNANKIAEELDLISSGWYLLSSPMSGAIARVLEISLNSLVYAVRSEFSSKVEENVLAAKKGYEVVKC